MCARVGTELLECSVCASLAVAGGIWALAWECNLWWGFFISPPPKKMHPGLYLFYVRSNRNEHWEMSCSMWDHCDYPLNISLSNANLYKIYYTAFLYGICLIEFNLMKMFLIEQWKIWVESLLENSVVVFFFLIQEYRVPLGLIELCGDIGPKLNALQAVVIAFFLFAVHTFSISIVLYNWHSYF